MQRQVEKPIERSALRLRLGSAWFTLLRYGRWYFGGLRFAKQVSRVFPHEVKSHERRCFAS